MFGQPSGWNGAAYVFVEPADGWTNMTETCELTPSNGSPNDLFGHCVAINGDTAVVGEPVPLQNGAGYVFKEPATGWPATMTQTAKLTTTVNGASLAEVGFGNSIATNGTTVVMGVEYGPSNGLATYGYGPGMALVFEMPPTGWADEMQTAVLTAYNGNDADAFGESVAISGHTIVVGAPGVNSYTGAAYVFAEPSSGWTDMRETEELVPSDGAPQYSAGVGQSYDFGYSVAVSGATALVNSTVVTDLSGGQEGGVYVFTEPSGGWINTDYEKCTLTEPNQGPQLAMSGQTFVCGPSVGALTTQNAYVFTQPAQWTLMIYLDGQHRASDPSLDNPAIADFLQMAGVGSTANVNIVVEFARQGPTTSYGDWSGVREGIMEPGDTPDADWGALVGSNLDMSNQLTLADFLVWAESSFPASNYGLVLWDHGSGYGGACEGPAGGNITPADLTTVIAGATDIPHIGFLGFDACLMGMTEVAYQVRNVADVMVASESNETGWDYTPFLQTLTGNPSLTAQELGQSIVAAFGAYYSSLSTASTAISCIDESQMANLASAINGFDDVMINSATPPEWIAVGNALAATQNYCTSGSTFSDYRNLGDFMSRVEAAGVNSAIVSAASAVRTALEDAVVQQYATSDIASGSNGLTIYAPGLGGTVNSSYSNSGLSMLNEIDWEQFLTILTTEPFVASISPATGPDAGGTTVTITGANFANLQTVTFGGAAATVQSSTLTEIVVTSPEHDEGTAHIRVTTSGDTSTEWSGDEFNYTSVNPPPSPPPGNLGVFSGGYWYLDMHDTGTYSAGDGPFTFGFAGATPVVGDWDGSGKTELGVYNQGTWWLDTATGVQTFSFGFPSTPGNTVIPVVGDWNGSGTTKVGVYCNGAWFFDYDGSHTWDATNQAHLAYLGWNDGGTNTVIPVPGCWAGNGKTQMGVYCNGVWFLDSTGSGQWDNSYSYWGWSSPSSPLIPVAGNWSGTGDKDQFGVYNQGVWFRDADGTHQWDAANQAATAYFGWAGAQPVAGYWYNYATDSAGTATGGAKAQPSAQRSSFPPHCNPSHRRPSPPGPKSGWPSSRPMRRARRSCLRRPNPSPQGRRNPRAPLRLNARAADEVLTLTFVPAGIGTLDPKAVDSIDLAKVAVGWDKIA